jgi:hypothetical protein
MSMTYDDKLNALAQIILAQQTGTPPRPIPDYPGMPGPSGPGGNGDLAAMEAAKLAPRVIPDYPTMPGPTGPGLPPTQPLPGSPYAPMYPPGGQVDSGEGPYGPGFGVTDFGLTGAPPGEPPGQPPGEPPSTPPTEPPDVTPPEATQPGVPYTDNPHTDQINAANLYGDPNYGIPGAAGTPPEAANLSSFFGGIGVTGYGQPGMQGNPDFTTGFVGPQSSLSNEALTAFASAEAPPYGSSPYGEFGEPVGEFGEFDSPEGEVDGFDGFDGFDDDDGDDE